MVFANDLKGKSDSEILNNAIQNRDKDGIDIRNGCHHIVISDITGCTVELLAGSNPYLPLKSEIRIEK